MFLNALACEGPVCKLGDALAREGKVIGLWGGSDSHRPVDHLLKVGGSPVPTGNGDEYPATRFSVVDSPVRIVKGDTESLCNALKTTRTQTCH